MAGRVADPFGSRATDRGPGWVRIVLGALLVVAGVVTAVAGIVGAVASAARIEDDAVGRATVRSGEVRDVVRFTVPGGERRRYTVYLLFDGVESNSTVRELMVRDTGCAVDLPDGAETTFRGARQGVSATLGDASSVGHFSSQPGPVRVRCAYITGTRRSERVRDDVPYVVTPGTPGGASAGALLIVGGVFGALGGGALGWWGWSRRRRVAAPAAAPA